MGKEGEEARCEGELGPYGINDSVVKLAKPDVLVMHCLPAHRGQEIDAKTFEAHPDNFRPGGKSAPCAKSYSSGTRKCDEIVTIML